MKNKVCKKCNKELPEDCKYKYCEYCRGKQVTTIKKVGIGVLAVVGAVGSTLAVIASATNKSDNK